LVKNLDDIRQIVVKSENGTPIKIGDIGEVKIGSAMRYGAVSHNGEGEIVLGIVMMLKGENAANVIQRVKERVAQIQSSCRKASPSPRFWTGKNWSTAPSPPCKTNLIEGALIVIFMLVLLVGNFRAGLIIASVIPLSMLFALGMMQLTGVSANLMSLVPIDFGLIVDGAVIIVEATLHFLHEKVFINENRRTAAMPGIQLSQDEMNEAVRFSSSKIMRSSVFGVIIILIVYLPILSLVGRGGQDVQTDGANR
jgi:cobalt-zinc-cadmium resistance protein CzcA